MIKEYDYLYKIVIIGNSSVGKSSILVRFSQNKFEENYLATIGVDFRFATLKVQDKDVKFQIWDTAGQQKFRTITSAYYRGSKAILFVFDLTDKATFVDIQNFWIGEVQKYTQQNTLFVLVGNKLDLVLNNPRIQEQQIKKLYTKKNMLFMQCSAKTNTAIGDLFVQIAKKLMKKQPVNTLTSKQLTNNNNNENHHNKKKKIKEKQQKKVLIKEVQKQKQICC